jgi:hypothetical protein
MRDGRLLRSKQWTSALLAVVVLACSSGNTHAPSVDAAASHARAFATSTGYTGNLRGEGNASTGPLAADELCRQVAAAAGLSGTFKAWLSDATTNAIDRLQEVPGGWYSVPMVVSGIDGGTEYPIAADKSALVAHGVGVNMLDERGHVRPGCAWTGTLPDGTKVLNGPAPGSDGRCTDWTSSGADYAAAGNIGPVDTALSECDVASGIAVTQCSQRQPIYCFEQD